MSISAGAGIYRAIGSRYRRLRQLCARTSTGIELVLAPQLLQRVMVFGYMFGLAARRFIPYKAMRFELLQNHRFSPRDSARSVQIIDADEPWASMALGF